MRPVHFSIRSYICQMVFCIFPLFFEKIRTIRARIFRSEKSVEAYCKFRRTVL